MGSNIDGRLGIGNRAIERCSTPTLVEGVNGVTQVACGWGHTLALTSIILTI